MAQTYGVDFLFALKHVRPSNFAGFKVGTEEEFARLLETFEHYTDWRKVRKRPEYFRNGLRTYGTKRNSVDLGLADSFSEACHLYLTHCASNETMDRAARAVARLARVRLEEVYTDTVSMALKRRNKKLMDLLTCSASQ